MRLESNKQHSVELQIHFIEQCISEGLQWRSSDLNGELDTTLERPHLQILHGGTGLPCQQDRSTAPESRGMQPSSSEIRTGNMDKLCTSASRAGSLRKMWSSVSNNN